MRRFFGSHLRAGAPIAAALALGCAAMFGCERVTYYSISGASSSGGAPGPAAVVTRSAVLGAIGACATATYRDFAAAAAELAAAAQQAADSPSAEAEAAARAAWARAIGAWQQAEILRVGAAGPPSLPGGQGLRDFIYSWPLVSRCLVEQTLAAEVYARPTFLRTALINQRGLAAAEYLLHYTGTDNSCGETASINALGTWAAIAPDALARRKAAYAAIVTADVADKARLLADAWTPEGGDFGAELRKAGGSGGIFSSDQLALNAVSDGIFYIEQEVKDLKLGRPLGIVDCASASCPEAVESQYAGVARDHVRNNLLGFRRVFAGCEVSEELGLDDLLRAMGAGPVADHMTDSIAGALAAADALAEPDLRRTLEADRPGVERLHAALKKISDTLKTEFVTVLDLELPRVVEGDND